MGKMKGYSLKLDDSEVYSEDMKREIGRKIFIQVEEVKRDCTHFINDSHSSWKHLEIVSICYGLLKTVIGFIFLVVPKKKYAVEMISETMEEYLEDKGEG